MINIITNFDMIYLTSQLPEKLEISTDRTSIGVTIYLQNVCAYESTMYPYNGVVTVNDLRSIVETTMKANGFGVKIMSIEVWAEGENTQMLDDIAVVYSTLKPSVTSEEFLRNNFLMSSKSILVPRSETIDLYYFNNGAFQDQITAHINYTLLNNPDNVMTYTWNGGSTNHTYQENYLKHVSLGYNYFQIQMYIQTGMMYRIISVIYEMGNKSYSIFFTEDGNPMAFQFVNAFGCREMAFVYGKEAIKTETEHAEAVLGRKTVYYDDKVKVTHEVETAPMTYNQAMAMNQLLTSPEVKRRLNNTRMPEVLLSDLGSEISTSDKDEIKLKFSWRYADGTEWL